MRSVVSFEMPNLVATVGDPTANSYETTDEADEYFDERLALVPPWIPGGADPAVRALLTATRLLENYSVAQRKLYPAAGGIAAYYRTSQTWTGSPATSTQKLSWPRIGMFDANGNPIPSDVIPLELKQAESEFAGQLLKTDRTLDNDVIVQGIKSISAGSVSLSFKDTIVPQVIPDAVFNMLLPSWLTDEIVEYAYTAEFDIASFGSRGRHGRQGWP